MVVRSPIRGPARWLISLIWVLCAPELVALAVGIPAFYMDTNGNHLPQWRAISLLASGGGLAILLSAFLGPYFVGSAALLWILLCVANRVDIAVQKKIEAGVTVAVALVGYLWVLHVWHQAH